MYCPAPAFFCGSFPFTARSSSQRERSPPAVHCPEGQVLRPFSQSHQHREGLPRGHRICLPDRTALRVGHLDPLHLLHSVQRDHQQCLPVLHHIHPGLLMAGAAGPKVIAEVQPRLVFHSRCSAGWSPPDRGKRPCPRSAPLTAPPAAPPLPVLPASCQPGIPKRTNWEAASMAAMSSSATPAAAAVTRRSSRRRMPFSQARTSPPSVSGGRTTRPRSCSSSRRQTGQDLRCSSTRARDSSPPRRPHTGGSRSWITPAAHGSIRHASPPPIPR